MNVDTPNELVYRIQDLKKEYAGRVVTDIERLDIRRGQVLALVGPSGAGKSTLLRLLNFLEHPTTGQIIYQGRDISGSVPLSVRRQVTTVFQRPMLLKASVHDNVAYGLRLRRQRVDGQVHDILARVGLEHVVRHQDDRRPTFSVMLAHNVFDQPDVVGVEIGCRLVEQQHGRVYHQRPRQCHPLHLAAR